MSYTGSISINRISVGIPPPLRQKLCDEARINGLKVPELIRHLLARIYEEREAQERSR